MNYVLPKVNISYKESEIPYSIHCNSLQQYLNTFEPTGEIENSIITLSKYKPKSNSFFVMFLALLSSPHSRPFSRNQSSLVHPHS